MFVLAVTDLHDTETGLKPIKACLGPFSSSVAGNPATNSVNQKHIAFERFKTGVTVMHQTRKTPLMSY